MIPVYFIIIIIIIITSNHASSSLFHSYASLASPAFPGVWGRADLGSPWENCRSLMCNVVHSGAFFSRKICGFPDSAVV